MAQHRVKFPADQFEILETEVKTQERAPSGFSELIPLVQVDANAETLGNLTVEFSGKAGRVTGKAGEVLNTIDFTASKATTKVFDLGFAIPIDLTDIRSAALGNLDSSRIKMEGSLEVHDESLYDLAMTGSDVEGLTGLANIPEGTGVGQVSVTTVPKNWDLPDTTGDDILNDLMECYNRTATQTKNRRPADTLVMSLPALILANGKRVTGASGRTAMQEFRQAVLEGTGRTLMVRTDHSFNGELLMYQFDRDVLRLNVAQVIRYLEEQWAGLGYIIPVHYRYSGLQIRNSFAFAKSKGILSPAALAKGANGGASGQGGGASAPVLPAPTDDDIASAVGELDRRDPEGNGNWIAGGLPNVNAVNAILETNGFAPVQRADIKRATNDATRDSLNDGASG